jgi:hypothetical protein
VSGVTEHSLAALPVESISVFIGPAPINGVIYLFGSSWFLVEGILS